MTTKTKWRLAKLPTPDELVSLVNNKIITNEEAKEILVSQEDDKARDIESLESEIKFLRNLVDQLSKNNRSTIIESIKTVEVPYIKQTWYDPYKWYCTADAGSVLTTTAGGNTIFLSANDAVDNFSDIKTF